MVEFTDKQQAFIDEYIIDMNATKAAIRAGYSEKTAYSQGQRLLKNVEIFAAIQERMNTKSGDRIAKQDEILELLTEIVRGGATGTALVGIGGGAQRVDQLPPSLSERTKAAELLGKRYAMWTEKQEVDIKGAVQFVDDIGGDEDAT